MAEKGVVVELKNQYAVVKMVRTEACAKCRACIAGMSEKEMFLEAENVCNAQVDDWVEMELSGNGFYQAVLIMYGIPLVALIGGILSGYYFFAPFLRFSEGKADLLSFLVGMIAVGIAFLWVRSQEHRWRQKKYRPIAIRITEPD